MENIELLDKIIDTTNQDYINDNINLINNLRKKGYAVSVIELKDDYDGKNKDMLYIEVSNKRIKEVTSIVKKFAKDAFLVVNETKLVQNGLLK